MEKHTPGPWKARMDDYGPAIVSERGILVTLLDCENKHDTALIASAPELLEACKFVLQEWNEPESEPETLERLKSVIRKAEGLS